MYNNFFNELLWSESCLRIRGHPEEGARRCVWCGQHRNPSLGFHLPPKRFRPPATSDWWTLETSQAGRVVLCWEAKDGRKINPPVIGNMYFAFIFKPNFDLSFCWEYQRMEQSFIITLLFQYFMMILSDCITQFYTYFSGHGQGQNSQTVLVKKSSRSQSHCRPSVAS